MTDLIWKQRLVGHVVALRAGCALALVAALAGCASGPRALEVHVHSYGAASAPAHGLKTPLHYQLQLLPSQMQPEASFAQVEAAAVQALQRVGLHRVGETGRDAEPAATAATLIAQIAAHTARGQSCQPSSAVQQAGYGPVWGWTWGWGWWDTPLGMQWMLVERPVPQRTHCHSVRVVLRERSSEAIVFEGVAEHEDHHLASPAVWSALFGAATADFPHTNPTRRTVHVPQPVQ